LEWDDLLRRHGPALVLYARQWTGTRAEAEDAMQDGVVKFWRAGGSPAPEQLPRLFAAVRRCAIDGVRRRLRRAARERRYGEDTEDADLFEHAAGTVARERVVEDAVRRLPPEQREVLVMKIWGGLTFEQIGVALDIPPNTAASRHRYALERLRKDAAAAAEDNAREP
jgi:RNA polymerase sigma-70 factor (ECF subfamily)